MSWTPKVSVVTATFNSSGTLRDTICSVRAQNYPDVEHIIVDGGSTDGTIELVRSETEAYPGTIAFHSGPDEGIYDAMNRGLAMASGEILGILNSDDLFSDSHVIHDVVDRMRTAQADILYADLVFVHQLDTDRITRVWRAGEGHFRWGWVPPHPTLYIRRDVYERFGPYRKDMRISADYDFMSRVFAEHTNLEVTYLPRVIVRMREGGASTKDIRGNIIGFREVQTSMRARGVKWGTITNALRVTRKVGQLARGKRRVALEDLHADELRRR